MLTLQLHCFPNCKCWLLYQNIWNPSIAWKINSWNFISISMVGQKYCRNNIFPRPANTISACLFNSQASRTAIHSLHDIIAIFLRIDSGLVFFYKKRHDFLTETSLIYIHFRCEHQEEVSSKRKICHVQCNNMLFLRTSIFPLTCSARSRDWSCSIPPALRRPSP